MKKPEILSPCGDMECLKAAVFNGCDAVYFGGENFGARKFAKNFTREEIIEAVKFCHLYGVRVYVTVNTITYENEMNELIDYVRFLHKNNVDAIIVQDLGVMNTIRHIFPNMEIHASTQAHNYDYYSVKAMKDMGCKRAVLARELSLDEIKNINVDIEKEVFVHGALCLCYSGNCLFSAFNNSRSGNRGECVGSCRMKYKFLEGNKEVPVKGEYPLSTRSLCTLDRIGDLIDAGIDSFKIEGRMKSKEYVGYITRLYKEKRDEYLDKHTVTIKDEEITNLKKLYNRELTQGYLFNKYNNDYMNMKTSNHIGVVIGDVISVDSKVIKFKLTSDITQEDGIRFDNDKGMIVNKLYNSKMLLVNKLSKGDIAIVDNKIGLTSAKKVRKTIDVELNKEINNFPKKQIPIDIKCTSKIGKELTIKVICDKDEVTVIGNIVEEAKSSPISSDRIKEQLSKLGGTAFISNNIEIDTDNNVFISIKELNDLRRDAINKLTSIRENKVPHEFIEKDYKINIHNENKSNFNINVSINSYEQLNEVIKYNIHNIYTDNYELYTKYKDKYNMFYRTDRVEKHFKELKNERILASNLSAVIKYSKDNYVVSDTYLNIINKSAIEYLTNNNVKLITLSYENTLDNLKELKGSLNNIEVIVYGTVCLMVMKHDIIGYLTNDYNKEYYIEGINKDKYRVLKKDDNTYIYNRNKYNIIDNIDYIKSLGVNNIRIELFDEDKFTINRIMNEVTNG